MIGVEELVNEKSKEGTTLGEMDGLQAVQGLLHLPSLSMNHNLD